MKTDVNAALRKTTASGFSERCGGFVISSMLGVVIAASIAALISILYIYSCGDELLEPEVAIVLRASHDTVPRDENLFYAILAFDSVQDLDINQQGWALYDEYLKSQKGSQDQRVNINDLASFKRQPFVGDRGLLCGAKSGSETCIERAKVSRSEVSRLLHENRLLLERYRQLAKYEKMQNPMIVRRDTVLPSMSQFHIGRLLLLTEAAINVGDGKVDDAIEVVLNDLSLTRRRLANNDLIMIEKMIFATEFRQTLMFISELIRVENLSEIQLEKLRVALSPLTALERSIVGPITRDFLMFASLVYEFGDKKITAGDVYDRDFFGVHLSDFLNSFVFKTNASINYSWNLFLEDRMASVSGCNEYLEYESRVRQRSRNAFFEWYNPVGKKLSRLMGDGFNEYVKSMCDLGGMVNLVNLQVELKSGGVPRQNVAEYVKSSVRGFTNPFTDKPMDCSQDEHALSFAPLAKRDQPFFPWRL